MRLSTGSTLGPYEILSPIGAGGMGEVYRARDTRLDREVAIKVLATGRAADPQAIARFEREAQAVAALSHPNVLAIHDFGHHEDAVYIVSELLEGETLGQRLAAGPLPVRKAVDCGAQIARGLAAAHARGIVHRDLKPDNVFLTRDGQVKILDFGLAKFESQPSEPGTDRTMTRMGSHTEPGTVMGTVGYMSPEQLRGLPADHRTDIFTLGAILYEMLTGRRAFAGSTPADTSSAILTEDPPEIGETDREVPASVELLVRHCLEKIPDERFQSARDLAFALERLSSSAVGSVPAPVPPARPSPRAGALLALGLIAVAAALAGGFVAGRRSAPETRPEFDRLTFRRGLIRSARMAPDGRTIVYGAAWEGQPIRLYSTRVEGPESRRLDLPDADILAISSRGEMAISIGRRFLSPNENTGTLARVALAGGAPRLVLENVQEADWSPDGAELAVVHEVEGHNRLEYPIGNVLYETTGWVSSPRVSPDGRRIAFIDHEQRWDDGGFVTVCDLEGNRERLTPRWSSAEGLAWSASGERIWFTATAGSSARALHRVSLTGEQQLVYAQAETLTLFDVMPGGRALIGSTNQRRELRVGSAGEERDLSWLDWTLSTFLSRDGKTVLINEQGAGGGVENSIYLRGTDGSPPVLIGTGIPIALSPDGRWVLAHTGATQRKLVIYPTGPGAPREIGPSGPGGWGGWFPDSRRILFGRGGGGALFRVFVHDIDGDSRELPYDSITVDAFADPVAPDGRRFLARGFTGAARIYSLDGGEPREIPGLEPADTALRFGPDGRWVYFYRRGMPAEYGRVEIATGRRESFGELAPPDRAGAVGVWPVLISEDGRSYAYSYPRFLVDLYMMDLGSGRDPFGS